MLLVSAGVDPALGGGIACRENDVCQCDGKAKFGLDGRWTEWKKVISDVLCEVAALI